MKKSTQYNILILEALIFAVLAVVQLPSISIFAGIMAFPFEQIGLILRLISLSGIVGNVAAIAIYIAICLSPLVILALRKNHKFYPEDGLAVLLSLTLFVVIFQMINPGSITLIGGFPEGIPIAKSILGGTAYSILLGYVILRVLRLFYAGGFDEIQRYMYVLLFILNILFVAVISYGGLNEIINSIKEMHINNSANDHLYGINYFFIALGFLASYLPYALNILIVFSAMSLLKIFSTDRYSEKTLTAADKLAKDCGLVLIVTVLINVFYNILQLFFAGKIFSLNSSVPIPIFSTVFVLACLLLVKLLQENKDLKDESDSII